MDSTGISSFLQECKGHEEVVFLSNKNVFADEANILDAIKNDILNIQEDLDISFKKYSIFKFYIYIGIYSL